MEEIVVGIDSSTQSTKAIAWTRSGVLVAEGRSPIALHNPRSYWFEQRCKDWWDSCCQALKVLMAQIDPGAIVGVSISNQRETIGFLDHKGEEVRPAMLWLDERSRSQVAALASEIGADVIHNISGRPVDIIPPLYRLAWLRENEPHAFEQTVSFTDVHAYLVFRLCGVLKTSWFSADPMGYFNIQQKKWSQPLLDYLGLSSDRLPKTVPPGTLVGNVSDDASVQTGLVG